MEITPGVKGSTRTDTPAIQTVQERVALASQDILGLEEGKRLSRRSPEAIRDLREKIGLLSRVFSKQGDIELVPSPNGGWACGLSKDAEVALSDYLHGKIASIDDFPDEIFEPDRIYYDLDDLAFKTEPEVLGVTRHEIGHANHSDYKLFVKGQRLAIDEGHLPTTWATTHNALEDPWINNKECEDSSVVRQQMDALYNGSLPEIVEKINSQPIPHQLNLNIIHYWHTGESILTLENKDVLDAFERIKPLVDEYFQGENAQVNFDTARKIFDQVKHLSHKAISDEMMKEAARSLSGSELGTPGSSSGMSGGDASSRPDAQPGESSGGSHGSASEANGQAKAPGRGKASNSKGEEGIWGWVKRKLGWDDEEKQESRPKSPSSSSRSQSPQVKSGGSAKKDAPRRKPSPEEAARDKDIHQGLEQNTEKNLKDELRKELDSQEKNSSKQRALPNDIDLSKLSKETHEALKKAVDELPEELKEKLKKKAREILDEKNAEDIKKRGSKSLQPQKNKETGEYEVLPNSSPNEKQTKAAQAQRDDIAQEEDARRKAEANKMLQRQEQRRQQTQEQLEQQRMEAEMKTLGFSQADFQLYREFKALERGMEGRISQFIRDIERELPMKEMFTYGGSHYSGPKLDRHSLAQRIPVGDPAIYNRKQVIRSTEPRLFIELIVDYSPSMEGEKMDNSIKTSIFLARVLKRWDVPFAITFFSGDVRQVKSFDQDYDAPQHKIFPKLMRYRAADGNGTNIGRPLFESHDRMSEARRRYPKSHGAIWIISDGDANQGLTGNALRDAVQKMQKTFPVTNFLLSGNSSEGKNAKSIFGPKNVVQTTDFSELPNEAANMLRGIFRRMQRRH